MEILEVAGARIAGLAASVPADAVPNDPKVAAATGIPARRVAPDGVSALDLCLAAARRVLADTGAQPGDFGAILAVSFTQETRMPSLAAQAQARLGFPKGILAFDLLQACAGWGYGLYLAALLVRETGKKVLLLDGDKQSAFLKADDPATASLLSDGGTATVVESGGDAIWRFAFQTDGEKGEALKLARGGTIEMDGFGVFRFVATDVVAFLKAFLSASMPVSASPSTSMSVSLSASLPASASVPLPASASVSLPAWGHTDGSSSPCAPQAMNWASFLFVPHQPNVYMVRQLAKAVGLEDRVLLSADRFGNLASASVPTTIAAQAARFASMEGATPVLIAGFGGGLAISAGFIDIPSNCHLSVEN